jgi:arylsulfatase
MPDYPNVLWLMTDEQRTDSLGYSGTPWAHTPYLDRLASAGTRFNAAYTPSPVCVSARVSLLTGLHASSTGVLNNHQSLPAADPRFLTWTFADHGYQTASFGKQHYNCTQRAFDVEVDHVLGDKVGYFDYRVPIDLQEAGVVRYDGGVYPWLFAGQFPGTVEETPEMHNVERALAWMQDRDRSLPYFLRLSFNAPHTPVVTPPPFDTLIDADAIDLPLDASEAVAFVSKTHRDYFFNYAGTHRLTVDQIRRARQCYYGHVAYVDHCFGRLLEVLDARGDLENTLIAFVSDHGTHLGDHGFFQKQSFWEASVRVPFFFTGPDVRAQEVETPVNAGSLLPTLLEMAGLPVPEHVEFASLRPTLQAGTPPEAAPVFSEIDFAIWDYRPGDRYVMVRDGRWKLSLYRDPAPAGSQREGRTVDAVLFDLEADPKELYNLAGNPSHAPVLAQLIAKLDAWDRRGNYEAQEVIDGSADDNEG